MDPDKTAAEMIIHQALARDAAETLRDASVRGLARPSITRVVARIDALGFEASEHDVARALRKALGSRKKERCRPMDSRQLPLFGRAA